MIRAMPWRVVVGPFDATIRQQTINRQHFANESVGFVTCMRETTVLAAAEVLGVSERSVHRWQDGQDVSIQTVEKIADHVGRHPAELWGDQYWTMLQLEPRNESHCP